MGKELPTIPTQGGIQPGTTQGHVPTGTRI